MKKSYKMQQTVLLENRVSRGLPVLCNFKFQLCTKALRPNANRDAYRSTCNGGNLNKIARLKYS